MSKAVKIAKKLVKEGDEALSTGLFKWNKDYPKAASRYEEAAKLFCSAKDYNRAHKAYEKCVAVNQKQNDLWAAARNYEAMVIMSIERTDGVKPTPEPLIKWTAKAGSFYRQAKSPNSYTELVKKVTKYLDDEGQLIEAENLYKSVLNDLEEDGEQYLRSEMVVAFTGLLVKLKRYPECIRLFEREYALKKQIVNKGGKQNLDLLALTIIAINLLSGDVDKAEKKLQDFAIEIRDFIKSPEFDVSEKMIEASIDGNQEKFDNAAQRMIVNNIYPMIIIKELRSIKVKAAPPTKKNLITFDDNIRPNDNNGIRTQEQRQKAMNDFMC